jgi:integrase
MAPPPPLTVLDLVERYLASHVGRNLKPNSRRDVERYLRAHWRPLHARPAAEVTRADVAARLGELVETSGPVSANRARTALSALFAWTMRQGLAEANPVAGTAKPAEERARERVLSDAELAAVWRATGGPGDYDAIVRLLLLTGQRREEVASMAWSELDLERGLWSVPGVRTKNGRPHEVPLAGKAAAVLRGRARREGRELVFGEGAGSFSGWSQAKRRLDRRVQAALDEAAAAAGREARPMGPWRLHDLRRTAVAGMAELGVPPHVIEAIVNHISGHKAGVAGIYNRATYAGEKRVALERWAEHVLAMVSGEALTGIPLRQAG